ncbi:MAG: hypothetical protein IM486_13725 [Microcystis sp. M114S2]|uniref:hypothetical protein n=1 Tax=unclassified Microcystis TaxID=2643300 RepID=UPI0025856140|nr:MULTISPECIES: hypothetical protein [unclassified Microcystis]MCA2665892.1 hypothetical protein [Microcystis sp. M045S2]MCA2712511.1 hypothetical protein [Microcystis sp. M172S2]MCA2805063.1 hypothetical protein [Microcystis sp. M114S2]MCA2835281.1 hypothetical protein [Microcystis sp. M007S1]MCA2842314.1 hypothetical protein [Microcystis sp. M079S1]
MKNAVIRVRVFACCSHCLSIYLTILVVFDNVLVECLWFSASQGTVYIKDYPIVSNLLGFLENIAN